MKRKISILLKLIISGILLFYLFTIIPFSEILSSIKSAEILLVIIGIILAAPIQYFSAFETQYLTKIQGMHLSTFEILKIHLTTNFYSFFLPGTIAGGAVKWYKFSKHGNKPAAAAVVVFNRFLEILITVFIGIIFSFPVLYSMGDNKLLIALILIFFSMVLLYFILLNRSGLNFIERIFSLLPFPNIATKSAGKFIAALHQFQNLRLKDHLEITGLLFLYHGIGIISLFCFARSLNIDLSIWIIGWAGSAATIATMFPLSFAGLGIREATLVFILSRFGIMPNAAFALSFLLFFRSLLITLLGGLIELKENILSREIEKGKTIKTAVPPF